MRITVLGATGGCRTAVDLDVRGGHTTARADLAHCVPVLVGDSSAVRSVVSVASDAGLLDV
ncbi:hypothetical protein E1286_07970 [Nonomuraea terrae]|uniref:Uncharacterized protein n=1 Tax=Nonomuraea terrae TaxID=2530383 RepID=A0A4R4Z4J0_9ACTN|nr:hypothetical protein [Nonomuraea terrae]TDD52985.1 hypothetical protein E1286_07970 [Nonomuraea terrae]